MRVLLPPSEAKRNGGDENRPLQLAGLSHPDLGAVRRTVLEATTALAGDPVAMSAALKLGASLQFEIVRNLALNSSPTIAAIERYTGVLFDALDSPSLDAPARRFAGSHVLIHSALFGLLKADDPIPAYRLSHDSKLPGLVLKKLWREPVSAQLSAGAGVILDLRSETYGQLGPAPVRAGSVFVRVASESAEGRRRALSHFNKSAKGTFVRALCLAGIDHPTIDSVLSWAGGNGFRLDRGAPGQLDLIV